MPWTNEVGLVLSLFFSVKSPNFEATEQRNIDRNQTEFTDRTCTRF